MFGLIPKRLLAAALMFFQLGFHVAHAELSETWVDDDWADLVSGASVDGHTFGADAFAQIQAGIDATASNGVVHVAPGIYPGGVHLPSRPITLRSDAGTEVTIIDIDILITNIFHPAFNHRIRCLADQQIIYVNPEIVPAAPAHDRRLRPVNPTAITTAQTNCGHN